WRVRYGLVYLHYLSGRSSVRVVGGRIVLDFKRDEVAAALLEVSPQADVVSSLSNFFIHDGFGPAVGLFLTHVGDLGYRLSPLHLSAGFSKVTLRRGGEAGDYPAAIQILLVYGWDAVTRDKLIHLLAAESGRVPVLLTVCPSEPYRESGDAAEPVRL